MDNGSKDIKMDISMNIKMDSNMYGNVDSNVNSNMYGENNRWLSKFLRVLADVMFILLAGIVLITYLPGVIGFKSYRVLPSRCLHLQQDWSAAQDPEVCSLNVMSVVLCM